MIPEVVVEEDAIAKPSPHGRKLALILKEDHVGDGGVMKGNDGFGLVEAGHEIFCSFGSDPRLTVMVKIFRPWCTVVEYRKKDPSSDVGTERRKVLKAAVGDEVVVIVASAVIRIFFEMFISMLNEVLPAVI